MIYAFSPFISYTFLMELLKVEHLTKVIKKKTIVDDINLVVNSGEIVGFLGPNGAGKTTTIKMIMGLFKITEGDIYVCDHNIKTDFEAAMKNVGGIIENPDMYKGMTGRKNLNYYASMYQDIASDDIDQLVSLVKMSERIDDKVKSYSLGMRQRLGLAQALLHKPKLLILDEPTNGLDPIGIKEMRDLLKYLAKNADAGVLISSHLISEMELMCDRIYIIDDGRMIGEKTVNETAGKDHLEGIYNYAFVTSNNHAVYDMFCDMNANCKQNSSDISIVMKRKHIPKLMHDITAKGIDIYAMNQNQRSLEDDFISMTNGTKKQIR